MLLGFEPGSWSQPHTRQTHDLSTISLALKLGILREAAGGECGTLALQGAGQMSQRDPCLTAALREAQAEHSERATGPGSAPHSICLLPEGLYHWSCLGTLPGQMAKIGTTAKK